MKKKILLILLVTIMGLIFILSACNASISSMQSQIILDLIKDYIPVSMFMLRKFAHYMIYFILGTIIYLLSKSYKVSFIVFSLYAIFDEIHQYFVPGRSCELRDMMIDICGGITALIVIKIISYGREVYVKRTKNDATND